MAHMGDSRIMMTEEDVLKIVGDEDSGESDLTDAMPTIMRMVVRDMVNKRSSRKVWPRIVIAGCTLLGGGAVGGAAILPEEAPEVVPVVVESNEGAKTRAQIKELKRLSDEGVARDLRTEGVIADSFEWLGEGMNRKRGQPMLDPPDSLKEAIKKVQERRAEERRILEQQQRDADIWR